MSGVLLYAAVVGFGAFVALVWPGPQILPDYNQPPTPNEVCLDHRGVRQVTTPNGWGGGPYVVCRDGYATEKVSTK